MQQESQLFGAPFILDTGTYTADAYRQADGSWEIHGVGAEGLFKTMLEDAERISRKVAFLPLHAFKKPMRTAKLSLKLTGACTLSDGTLVACSSMLRRDVNKAETTAFSNAHGMMKYGHPLTIQGMHESTAKLVYAVLIEECGALPNTENTFVQAFSQDGVPPREFRINGRLGFGGKFRYPAMTVDCYPEDMTPAREKMIQAANDRLALYRNPE